MRIVIVCEVVAAVQVVQEKRVLDWERMRLFSAIVLGIERWGEIVVWRERRWRDVGRQVQGSVVEEGKVGLVGGAGSGLEATVKVETDEILIGELPMRSTDVNRKTDGGC